MLLDVGTIATRQSVRKMISHKTGSLLEIGVGLGLFLQETIQFQRCGLDLSFNTLQKAGRSVSDIPFVESDARELPFKNEVFDVVASTHVLEHIKDDLGVIREIHRVLKTQGELVLMVPAHRSGSVSSGEAEEMGHVRTYTKVRFEQLFKGLFVIEDIYYAHLLYNLFWIPVKRFLRYPNFVIKKLFRDSKMFYERWFYRKIIMPIFLHIVDPLDRAIGKEGGFIQYCLGIIEKRQNICLRARKL